VQELCLHPDCSRELEEAPPDQLMSEELISEVEPVPNDVRRRRPRDRWASFIAFSIAVGVHAAVIAFGLVYYQSVSHYGAPQLVLPKGWATEFEGAGDAGASALLKPAPPLDIPKPDAPATDASVLAPLSSEVEPPAVTPPPAVMLDARSGTSEVGPLPSLAGDATAPPVNFRSPPGYGATSGPPAEDGVISATSGRTADAALAAAGSAAMGLGRGDGGGPQGVPEGQPMPSSHNKHPTYPDIAQRNGWTGTTVLELELDASGRVVDTRLIQASGHEVLDRAAIDAAKTWRFTPATLDDRPVPATVRVPFPFSLASRER
jgi:TonB family protein